MHDDSLVLLMVQRYGVWSSQDEQPQQPDSDRTLDFVSLLIVSTCINDDT